MVGLGNGSLYQISKVDNKWDFPNRALLVEAKGKLFFYLDEIQDVIIDRFSRYYVSVVSKGLYYRNYDTDEIKILISKSKHNLVNNKQLMANEDRSLIFYKSSNTAVTVIYDLNKLVPSYKEIDLSSIIEGKIVEMVPFESNTFYVVTSSGTAALLNFDKDEFLFWTYKTIKPLKSYKLKHKVVLFVI